MTRAEHLQWCKERAKQEFSFYEKEGIKVAVQNGITSIMSDMSKHPETKSPVIHSLCLMAIMTIKSKQEFNKFIDAFN